MKSFQGNTANQIWLQVIKTLESQPCSETVSSRLGKMHELLHVGFTINEPSQRWIPSRIPALNPAFAFAEIMWIVNGSNDAEIINYWNPALPKFAGHNKYYHGAYGFRLREHFDFDQLEKAYYSLQKNGLSRQVVLQIWDPNSDFPDDNGQPVSEDIPCNLSSLLKIRNNKLEWMQINRSNDIYRGLPFNIVQFTTLQELMAGWLGIEVGTYNHLSDSLHLYVNDLKDLGYVDQESINKNTDRLNLSYDESQIYFSALFNKMKYIVKNDLSESDFYKLFDESFKVEALDNMFLILGADAARRKRYSDVSVELINRCTNPIYSELWRNWSDRQKSKIPRYDFI
jgi:thymidylate synthase